MLQAHLKEASRGGLRASASTITLPRRRGTAPATQLAQGSWQGRQFSNEGARQGRLQKLHRFRGISRHFNLFVNESLLISFNINFFFMSSLLNAIEFVRMPLAAGAAQRGALIKHRGRRVARRLRGPPLSRGVGEMK